MVQLLIFSPCYFFALHVFVIFRHNILRKENHQLSMWTFLRWFANSSCVNCEVFNIFFKKSSSGLVECNFDNTCRKCFTQSPTKIESFFLKNRSKSPPPRTRKMQFHKSNRKFFGQSKKKCINI